MRYRSLASDRVRTLPSGLVSQEGVGAARRPEVGVAVGCIAGSRDVPTRPTDFFRLTPPVPKAGADPARTRLETPVR